MQFFTAPFFQGFEAPGLNRVLKSYFRLLICNTERFRVLAICVGVVDWKNARRTLCLEVALEASQLVDANAVKISGARRLKCHERRRDEPQLSADLIRKRALDQLSGFSAFSLCPLDSSCVFKYLPV